MTLIPGGVLYGKNEKSVFWGSVQFRCHYGETMKNMPKKELQDVQDPGSQDPFWDPFSGANPYRDPHKGGAETRVNKREK